ncbi:hypothetical protein SAMN05421820_107203 [Pedobacter steynii]|uniref:Sel1 repeat family protein n=1 Tax=Pedobacter steynii TaxID=430522 RepID=A0A1H0AU94_9SPHI|nr:hypothetical protein [Pedobacter steynii]NQX41260.1 hypothetical protein [Pedobacter steynii]SDN36954.1 hypothetical protein SAMN05421820_107203 [Pedobacter steynii]
MKTNVSLLICLVSMLLLSCKNEKKEQFIAEIPHHTKLISNKEETLKLWKKAIHEGDFKAYGEISNAYLLHSQMYELYYYALIMANKYKCPQAYYHLFMIMNDQVTIDGLSLYSNDEATKNMALYYLLKSKELGYTQAQFEIDEVFGKNKPIPASSYYLKEVPK